MSYSASEKKFIEATRKELQSADKKKVLSKIRELKSTGNVNILHLLLNLLNDNDSQEVKQAVISLVGDLREQACVPVIMDFINQNNQADFATDLVAACWQSRLNFSNHLDTVAECFVIGDYQMALESFTLIEESLWQSGDEHIHNCRHYLVNNVDDISNEKKPLFNELIHVLESGKSQNSDEYPELYSDRPD
jgi:hypothetical protein